jgi:hypothetical protein
LVVALAAAAGVSLPAGAQDVSVTFGGQVRPRFELRDPLLGAPESFVSMRTRASVEADVGEGVGLFVQVQDVRFWGGSRSTLTDFSAPNFDLHQGYLQFQAGDDDWFTGRAGRQRTRLGGERLVGWVNWTQQGRTFDGVRLATDLPWGRTELVAYKLAESLSENHENDGDFLGLYSVLRNVGQGTLDAYILYNRMGGDASTSQGTLGLRHVGGASTLSYRLEGSYQLGERGGSDVSAFMVGARVGSTLADGKAALTLWYDHLSGGTPDADKAKVFDTLFATNHKFYGLADLFLNIPVQTDSRGLQDLALKGRYTPTAKVPILLEIHAFWLSNAQGLESSGHLGEEIDLTVRYLHSSRFTIWGGLSYVFRDSAFVEIGRSDQDMVWTYLMLDVAF